MDTYQTQTIVLKLTQQPRILHKIKIEENHRVFSQHTHTATNTLYHILFAIKMAMNQKLFLDAMANQYNDITRTAAASIKEMLQSANLLSDEVKVVIETFEGQIKQNKKIRKPVANKNVCGYHLFLRKMRKEVAVENPKMLPKDITGVVSRMWTKLSDEEKKVYNDQAAEMKRHAAEESKPASSEESEEHSDGGDEPGPSGVDKKKPAAPKKKKPVAPKQEDKPVTEEDKHKKKPTASNKSKKKGASLPPCDDETDTNEIFVVVEDLDSDVDV